MFITSRYLFVAISVSRHKRDSRMVLSGQLSDLPAEEGAEPP